QRATARLDDGANVGDAFQPGSRWYPRVPPHRLSAMRLIECVPNFSEGRDREVVERLRTAIAGVRGVHVLDWSSDASHNRSVITFVAPPATVMEAAFAGIVAARDSIDMRRHAGV